MDFSELLNEAVKSKGNAGQNSATAEEEFSVDCLDHAYFNEELK